MCCRSVVFGFMFVMNEDRLFYCRTIVRRKSVGCRLRKSVLSSTWFPVFSLVYFSLFVVGCQLSSVGVDCRLCLSVCLLLVVRCHLSNADCRLSGVLCLCLMLFPGCQVSVVGRWVLIVCISGRSVFLLSVPTSGRVERGLRVEA
jgi:hypothetical protein